MLFCAALCVFVVHYCGLLCDVAMICTEVVAFLHDTCCAACLMCYVAHLSCCMSIYACHVAVDMLLCCCVGVLLLL